MYAYLSWGKIPLQLWTCKTKQLVCFLKFSGRTAQDKYCHSKGRNRKGEKSDGSRKPNWANSSRPLTFGNSPLWLDALSSVPTGLSKSPYNLGGCCPHCNSLPGSHSCHGPTALAGNCAAAVWRGHRHERPRRDFLAHLH